MTRGRKEEHKRLKKGKASIKGGRQKPRLADKAEFVRGGCEQESSEATTRRNKKSSRLQHTKRQKVSERCSSVVLCWEKKLGERGEQEVVKVEHFDYFGLATEEDPILGQVIRFLTAFRGL